MILCPSLTEKRTNGIRKEDCKAHAQMFTLRRADQIRQDRQEVLLRRLQEQVLQRADPIRQGVPQKDIVTADGQLPGAGQAVQSRSAVHRHHRRRHDGICPRSGHIIQTSRQT